MKIVKGYRYNSTMINGISFSLLCAHLLRLICINDYASGSTGYPFPEYIGAIKRITPVFGIAWCIVLIIKLLMAIQVTHGRSNWLAANADLINIYVTIFAMIGCCFSIAAFMLSSIV